MNILAERARLCVLMERNVLSLASSIQKAHGGIGHHISEMTASELLTMLAINNIELKCSYLGSTDN